MSASRFRTIEVSDLRFDTTGLTWVTVKSKALRQRADITLWLPEQSSSARDLPLVMLLHGVYGSHWAWALKGGAHKTAARMIEAGEIPPLALAMPSDGLWGDGSGYVKHQAQDFETWIAAEVPELTRQITPSVTEASPVCISGLSMGGFGALRIAAKFPERFAAAGGHSSITEFEQMKLFVEEPLESYQCRPADCSVWETLRRNRDRLPPLRFDCGTEDLLIEHNRSLARQLKDAAIPHVYEEFPGGHEWPYWELHLADMLKFFAQSIRK